MKHLLLFTLLSALTINKAFSQYSMTVKEARDRVKEGRMILYGGLPAKDRNKNIGSIPIKDAGKHIGEIADVKGCVYAGKVERNKVTPNSVYELLYFRDPYQPGEDFIVLMKMKNFKGNIVKIQGHVIGFEKGVTPAGQFVSQFSASGRIFLYEGKPAV